MARLRRRPWFRALLLGVEEHWSGGPGLVQTVVRFGLFPNWNPPAPADVGGGLPAVTFSQLAPEIPYSVIPFAVQRMHNLTPANPPPGWQGVPVPRWRGVPCQVSTATAWLRNELPPNDFTAFPFIALFPQSNPPGPRLTSVLLGSQFLTQYGWRVVLDYAALRYATDPVTNRRQLAPGCVCGRLELF
jgi:hypothetical protein